MDVNHTDIEQTSSRLLASDIRHLRGWADGQTIDHLHGREDSGTVDEQDEHLRIFRDGLCAELNYLPRERRHEACAKCEPSAAASTRHDAIREPSSPSIDHERATYLVRIRTDMAFQPTRRRCAVELEFSRQRARRCEEQTCAYSVLFCLSSKMLY